MGFQLSNLSSNAEQLLSRRALKWLVFLGLSVTSISYIVKNSFIKTTKKYIKCGKVLRLVVYPVKSLPGVEFDQVLATSSGVSYGNLRDRNWLLIDENNTFITLRQEPSLVKLKVFFENEVLKIESPLGDSIEVETGSPTQSGDIAETRVWGGDIKGYDCGPNVAEFFQKFLNRPGIRMIQYSTDFTPRPVRLLQNNEWKIAENSKIAYHDAAPCLVVNENSIADLNARLTDVKVNFRNFRPSILVEAAHYSEDDWESMKIGDLEFIKIHRCTRCKVTTIDTESAEVRIEPLETLRSYHLPKEDEKKIGTGPIMGVYFSPIVNGTIKVGDDVYAC